MHRLHVLFNRVTQLVLLLALLALTAGPATATEWYVSPGGAAKGNGTKDSPWDIKSTLSGKSNVKPGDTVWLLAGTYKDPDRKPGSKGYVVRLTGTEDQPIHVRGEVGRRVTVDGGLQIWNPSAHLWIRDVEILVSENASMSRTVKQPGSHPSDYNRPLGGLNIYGGSHCKYINLVIHDNASGIGFWNGATDSEVHGCIIYDNGWQGPDRGHGHSIYAQNQNGVKTISNCIMTGGYDHTMHAYGSSRAYVDHFLITDNICYKGGRFLIGGGRPSRGIRVFGNVLSGMNLQLGYSAPQNEDCEVRNNVIVGGQLQIARFKSVTKEGNLVLGRNAPRPTDAAARFEMRPNGYDENRLHIAIFNWAKKPTVDLLPSPFLKPGDTYRLMDPRDVYGDPVVTGTFQGKPISVPMKGEFAAFLLLK